ncbi:NTP transferase domain-containing protein [Dyadobacter sp. CY323]|uniref:nucleotidyltransferase family protein n=1 Tax=Dyadobacter sp. CY323 TaxID=2907302 RepID=UPI001F165867|nr:nucleotidyltransferase family protein [Dyadobacter sp. CY323]MCE6989905.1 nucleotidyltransferase family protein [Dyadobacter sp. CY323]
MSAYAPYSIVILAAGNSSRLGEPKQLLKYQNKTLIRHITETALASGFSEVIIVTGSNSERIENELNGLKCHFTYNANWAEGMGSSIAQGIHGLQSMNILSAGVILAVSDQPFVDISLFQSLIDQKTRTNAGIVASSYAGTLGTPVLFSEKYFTDLLKLSGAEGAKKLLSKFSNEVTSCPFPLGNIDIDTKEDYKNLLIFQS